MSHNFTIQLPKFIAHRGASNVAPENTLAAMYEAFMMEASYFETDLKLTSCGELILFHDDTLERTTNGHGKVKDWSLEDLKQLDAGSWFSPEFKDEKIPTFKELIAFLQHHEMLANLELKPCQGRERQTAETFVEMYHQFWPDDFMPPIVSSYSFECIQIIQKHLPLLPRAIILDELNSEPDWLNTFKELDCYALHCCETLVPTYEHFQKLVQKVDHLCVFTVNDPLTAQKLIDWGVTSIFTDNHDVLSWSCYWDKEKEYKLCV